MATDSEEGAEGAAEVYIEWGGQFDHRHLTLDSYEGAYDWTDWDATDKLDLGYYVGSCPTIEAAKEKLQAIVFDGKARSKGGYKHYWDSGEDSTYIRFFNPDGSTQTVRKEDWRGETPQFHGDDKAYLQSWGVMAKLARGGWKRISMSTVQSDDSRFTITIIDPTRRGKWFLLKDLETGESYEEHTMTDAKKKALEIRGDEPVEEEPEEVEPVAPPELIEIPTPGKAAAVIPSGYGMSSEGEAARDEYQKLRRRYLYLAGRPRTPETVAKLDAAIKALTEFEKTHKTSAKVQIKNKLLKPSSN